MQPLVKINDLTVTINKQSILNQINLDILPFCVTAIVGESGSGKTTTGLAILKLLDPELVIKKGEILFDQEDILKVDQKRLVQIRGKDIGMVFQEPLDAFNPVFTIGCQIEEVLIYHTVLNSKQRRDRVKELLNMVELQDPARIANSYPHQLSGGMRQRAMIAQAIAAQPRLIIADEPTSNMDVTLQARIVELFRALREKLNLSILLITHDLGLVKHLADSVVVMKEGMIVEAGNVSQILNGSIHEYTRELVRAADV